ncbi:MAG: response regulator transcription factor [Bacteroidetes Order II. Incertae sedis bacterium]|nr:response regulator transcription factor [Bacteroidetes Order II. bacterium]
MARILLIEDEKRVASFVSQGLEEEGHSVTWIAEGDTGFETALEGSFDLILLDVRLPRMDGVEVASGLRIHRPGIPVLMLTALDSVEDRVRGLRAGADDYLAKPFAFEELLARIDALLRRRPADTGALTAMHGELQVVPSEQAIMWKGKEVDLTRKEYKLLAYLVARQDHAVSRENIQKEVWGEQFDRGTNVIDVYIRYLRQKLEKAGCPARLESVRGFGYKLSVS